MLKLVKPIMKRLLPAPLVNYYVSRQSEAALSSTAKEHRALDRHPDRLCDIPGERALTEVAGWLCRAQDHSATADGGVARHYSLNTGWSPSYPETTGYIVPTFIALARHLRIDDYYQRARSMLDWLLSIQLENGAFQGGMITHKAVPVTFNTGQILLGLAAGTDAFGDEPYRESMVRAATWLRDTQDEDGCWRRHPTPFAKPGDKTYETHVAWGLLEAERLAPGNGFGEAALRQIRWAITNIQQNGWIRQCCLSKPEAPLTHTLGYALKGIVEGYRFSGDKALLDAALKVGSGLRGCVRPDRFLPGRLDANWNAAVSWSCLTGAAQISASFTDLFLWTGDAAWHQAAETLLAQVRSTIRLDGPDGIRGGVAGSFPIDGAYGAFEYLNWAAKFFIDAQLASIELRAQQEGDGAELVRVPRA